MNHFQTEASGFKSVLSQAQMRMRNIEPHGFSRALVLVQGFEGLGVLLLELLNPSLFFLGEDPDPIPQQTAEDHISPRYTGLFFNRLLRIGAYAFEKFINLFA